MTIKAILFDMDGVLIEAKEWHYESLNKALELFGYNISRQDHLLAFDGLPTKDKLKMLTEERSLPRGLHPIINSLKQIYTMEIVYVKCKPIFCHQRALSQLKADGYKIAVCSNSIRQTIDLMMSKSGLMQYLDFFLSNEDVMHAKPHPEIYTTAMAKFSLKPEECLICEDNFNGIKAARDSMGHVFEIKNVHDVTYENIKAKILEIENS